jgi:hypothetical protein
MPRKPALAHGGIDTDKKQSPTVVTKPQYDAQRGHQAKHYTVPFLPLVGYPVQAPARPSSGRMHTMRLPLLGSTHTTCTRQEYHKKPAPRTEETQQRPWVTIPLPTHFYITRDIWTRGRIQTENYGFKVFVVPSALLNGFSGHFAVQSPTTRRAGGLRIPP